MRTVRSAARARNRARPRLAWLLLVVVLLLMVLTARLASAESLSTDECTDADEILDDDELDEIDAVDDGEEEHVYVIDEVVDSPEFDADRGYPFHEVIAPSDVDPPDRAENRETTHDNELIDARVDDVLGQRCRDVASAAELDDHAASPELPHEREASVRHGRSWLGSLAGRVDLSLTWRRHLASSGDIHGLRDEVWLVGTWRL